jgi:hypothetical protein
MTLCDPVSLAKAVEVQKRCYRFLQLIKYDRLPLTGGWSIGSLHDDSVKETERFKELVMAHFLDLPEEARPVSSRQSDLDDFANFFISYLFCSFEPAAEPRFVQIDNSETGGCWCELCARLTDAPNLKLKKVTSRDKAIAGSLEADSVRRLIEAEKISLSNEKMKEVLEAPNYSQTRALIAYGIELVRRCAGEYVDASSLVLWRRFAWEKGVPKGNFVLTADLIEKAERRLISRLKELAG